MIMLKINKIDHVGIRVREKSRAIDFHQTLGFKLIVDTGFEKGHPIMMRHECGIVLNLLGPSTAGEDENVLMDMDKKYAGYTHMALKIESVADAEAYFAEQGIAITGRFSFKDMNSIFIRDPDRNVIEFDEYPGDDPESRLKELDDDIAAYNAHP